LRTHDAPPKEFPIRGAGISFAPPAPVGKAPRLSSHDYASNGTYFVTICTRHRQPLLVGKVAAVVERELLALPARFGGLSIDCWKMMPDHLHVLVRLHESGATLSEAVQAFKSLSTRVAWQAGLEPFLDLCSVRLQADLV
jgi:REP element-mobilizing transposase RayT